MLDQSLDMTVALHAGHAFVNVAIEKTTGQAYAVKVVAIPEWDKALEPNSCTLEDVFKEIDILAGLDHPHVITLKEFFVENGQVTTTGLLDPCICYGSTAFAPYMDS